MVFSPHIVRKIAQESARKLAKTEVARQAAKKKPKIHRRSTNKNQPLSNSSKVKVGRIQDESRRLSPHRRRTVTDDGNYYIKRPESVGADIMNKKSLFRSFISDKPYTVRPIPDSKIDKLKKQGFLEVFDIDGKLIKIKDIYDL